MHFNIRFELNLTAKILKISIQFKSKDTFGTHKLKFHKQKQQTTENQQ
jgi:hypothetical protein